MIDQNPAKQGRYVPVTGIPILSPDVGVTQIEISDQVLVLNPNYLKEIQAQLPTGQDVKVVS